MEKPKLCVVRIKNVFILHQLQLEEALLRADDKNWCLLNEGSSAAVVMGISGKTEELLDKEHYRKSPIPIIKRFSGGGTVVVDEETLFITMICNKSAVNIPPFPKQILHWNGKLYQQALKNLDFQIKENDYAIGRHKFGGNAQYICKERWLHHSTLLWDFCPRKMNYLKIPEKMPDYRKGRDHTDFLCRLFPHFKDKKTLTDQIINTLSLSFEVEETPLEKAEEILLFPHRKATKII